MITHDQKAYLHDRMNSVMRLLFEIVEEMGKWETETPSESDAAIPQDLYGQE